MNSIKIISTGCILIFLVTFPYSQENLSAKQIVDKSYQVTKLAGSEAVSTMIIMDDKGNERVRKTAQVTKLYDNGDTEKKLIRFLSPADVKGTGFLTYDYENKDDDMWLYMPALRKTRRIISSEKAKSFMGSEFSYSDITPPNLEDFSYKLNGKKEINGTTCWEIEIIPNDDDIADENGYSRKITYIGTEDFVIRKALFYDLDEELHKELEVKEIKEIDSKNHKYRPVHMVMENKQNERKSILKVEKIHLKPDVKDDYFTTRYLERE